MVSFAKVLPLRVHLIVLFSLISLTTVAIHLQSYLFPSVNLSAFVIFALLTSYSLRSPNLKLSLLLVVIFSTLLRIQIFLFPASPIGYDPFYFVNDIRKIVASHGLLHQGFYMDIPFFNLLAATTSLILNISPNDAMAIFPLVIGLVLPLAVWSMMQTSFQQDQLILLAVILAVVGTTTLKYSYWPIPQTLSLVFWLIFLFVLIKFLHTRSQRMLIIIILLQGALIFTHKFAPLIVFLVTGASLMYVSYSRTGIVDAAINSSGRIVLILLILLSLQWVFATSLITQLMLIPKEIILADFLPSIVGRFASIPEPNVSSPMGNLPTAASPTIVGWQRNFIRRMSSIVMILLGIPATFAFAFWIVTNDRKEMAPVIFSILMLLPFVVIGFFDSSIIPPHRAVLLAESCLSIVVIFSLYEITPNRKVLLGLFLILLATQLGATNSVPDYSGTPRLYLNGGEVGGDEFVTAYVKEPVLTDYYFGTVNSERGKLGDRYKYSPEAFLNANISSTNCNFVLRRDIEVYISRPWDYDSDNQWWKLDWDIESVLNEQENRVYDNADLVTFKCRPPLQV